MVCEECGRPFESRLSKTVTCSTDCYQARYRRVNREQRAEASRLRYIKNREAYRAKAKVFRQANAERLNAADRARRPARTWQPRICVGCGVEYMPRMDPQQFCTRRCQKAHRARKRQPGNRYYTPPAPIIKTCEGCGDTFTAKRRNVKYCSRACVTAAGRRASTKWREAHPEEVTEKHRKWRQDNPGVARSRGHRRRATLRSLPKESFHDLEIYERDQWRCQLCGKKVPRRAAWPDPLTASLDHIIPIIDPNSPGHVRSNCQLAHLGCNIKKKDRTLPNGEQLRLI